MDKKNKITLDDIDSFVFDMDGTLLTSEKVISPKTIEIIKKLQEKNKNIFIATGRPWYFAKEQASLLSIKNPIISCNGALIYDLINDKLISSSSIDSNKIEHIIDILLKLKLRFIIYTSTQMYRFNYDKDSPWFKWQDETHKKLKPEHKFIMENVDASLSFDVKKHMIIKVLVISSEASQEQYDKLIKELDPIDGIYVVKSQSTVIDIMPDGSSKGTGLVSLSKNKLIDLNRTICFGDAENDISMFNECKYSVAMGEAKDYVKEKATFVTDSNDDNGIYNFINKVLFKNV